MTRAFPFTTDTAQQPFKKKHLLVVDKKGTLGLSLITMLKDQFSIVFVSKLDPAIGQSVLHVPFRKRIPTIPDDAYTHVVVFQNEVGEVDDFLLEVIAKARTEKAVCLFATSLGCYSESLLSAVHEAYRHARVVIYGDIFGHAGGLLSDTTIGRLLYQARSRGKLRIANTGMRKSYPVFVDDAMAVFSQVVLDETPWTDWLAFLFLKYPPTDLTLAHLLHKANPLLTIDFYDEKKPHKSYILPSIAGRYLLDDNYWLAKRVGELDTTLIKQEDMSAYDFSRPQNRESKQANYKFLFFSLLLFVVSFFVLSLLSPLFFGALGVWELKQTKSAMLSGNIAQALHKAQAANAFFSVADATVPLFSFAAGVARQDAHAEQFGQDITFGKEVAETLVDALTSVGKMQQMIAGKSASPRQDLASSINALHKSIRVLEQEKSQGKEFLSALQTLGNLADVLPTVFGFDKPKTYAVFFQNNMELRPGGGFMGSYGLLTMQKGKIMDFEIQNIYDADGQLKGHVEPPFAVRRYLPSAHLYLRDSNFAIDFPSGASVSAMLLNQEIGQSIDGIITVDVSLVKSLVGALGSVYVGAYDEKVTADNMYLLTQKHSEKNSFAGSTQKKDFLRSLLTAIELRMSEKKNISYAKVFTALSSALSEKHILFAFNDPTVQNAFVVNRFSSSLWDGRSAEQNTVNDFLGVSEANLGVNKANYFLKRKIKQDMIIGMDGTVSGKVTMYYKNMSEKDVWPGGDYKTYVRFVLPLGAKLLGIAIDGKEQKTVPAVTDFNVYEAKKFIAPKELEIETYNESDKTVYGMLVTVPTQAYKTITASYALAKQVSFDDLVFGYDLWTFKQPGTDSDLYEFSLTYPQGYNLVKKPDVIMVEQGNTISFATPLVTDQHLALQFVKN